MCLHPQINLEIYEFDPRQETLSRVDPRSVGNLDTWLVPRREAQSLLDQAKPSIEPIVALFPEAITVHPTVHSGEVWLRFRGLAFARWDDGQLYFGGIDPRRKLTSAAEPALRQLLQDLGVHRHPLARDTRHSLYRQQSERWLESIVRERCHPHRCSAGFPLRLRTGFRQYFQRARHSGFAHRHARRTSRDSGAQSNRTHPPSAAGRRTIGFAFAAISSKVILRGTDISPESSCSPRLRSCTWLRRRCAFIPRRMHCCAICRRRWKLFAWASRRVGAAAFASSCGSNNSRVRATLVRSIFSIPFFLSELTIFILAKRRREVQCLVPGTQRIP